MNRVTSRFILLIVTNMVAADTVTEDLQFLNDLPLDKLLRLKNSVQRLVTTEFESLDNVTTTTPIYENFGAQALAMQGVPKTPIRRGDYEEVWHKGGGGSKISNIFSMSVTTLAFLAFGGYLLCLIVHAVKQKQSYYNPVVPTTVQPATFFVSAGIKKKPHAAQPQFATYGRKRRDYRHVGSASEIDLPTEQMFLALLQLCEGYAKWSGKQGNQTITN